MADWGFSGLYSRAEEQVRGLVDAFQRESRDAGMSALITPVDPFNRASFLTPLVAAVGVAGVLFLSSVAAGALIAAAVALLAVYFLLTEVFGYEIELAMPPGA